MGVHLQPFTSEKLARVQKLVFVSFSVEPEQRTQCLALKMELGIEKGALLLFWTLYFLIQFAV